MSSKYCPSCGAPIDLSATECKYCGEKVEAQPQPPQQPQFTPPQYQPPQQPPYAPPQYQAPPQPQYTQPQYQAPQPQYVPPQSPYQTSPYNQYPMPIVSPKSKTTAGLLGIFLGGLGVHKFYIGKIGLGILYLVFCWTYIPSLIGFIEGIIYLCSSEESFYQKYVLKR